MFYENQIWFAKSGDEKVSILPKMANRHGMIAGATGTGKTVTLKVLAESFSDRGVPVFLADVKGDLAGMCNPGIETEDMKGRIERFGLAEAGFNFKSYPTVFWDVYGEKGLPLRTTISEMGPILLSRILGLNEIQSAILSVIFKIADDEGLLLIDTKDLRSMLTYVGEHAKDFSLTYGNMSSQSLGSIIRSVIALESEGGDLFFGEPALDIRDWMSRDYNGKGNINVLDCQKLVNNPTMYSTFLLWMLSELYETLPEAGDLDAPKIVFFFDEAHMLFDSASKALLDKIEQIVKLIRSKGVGVFFITQNPKDIPNGVLSQLGTKIQHALRAYTPAELKSAKAAAESFRENPDFDTFTTLTELGIGEALVSVLDEKGVPSIVQKCNILPPQSQMGAIDNAIRDSKIKSEMLYVKYVETVDRDSAYEFLNRKAISDAEEAKRAKEVAELEKQRAAEEAAALKEAQRQAEAERKAAERAEIAAQKEAERQAIAEQKAAEKAALAEQKAAEKAALAAQKEEEKKKAAQQRAVKSAGKSVANSVAGTLGREAGKSLGKSVGGSFGKTLGGNVGASLGRGIIGTLFSIKK
ncbi:MAG: DUF853 family protein [Lachnospiraceae bacterium]|nr:DUF853 family protein [Lachnospiraceae bacterium]